MKICDWVLIFPVRQEYGSDMDRRAHHKKMVVLVSVLFCGEKCNMYHPTLCDSLALLRQLYVYIRTCWAC